MYRKSNKGWLKHIDFILLDMISLEMAFFIAYVIRHGFYNNLLQRRSYSRMIFILLFIEFSTATLLRTFSRVIRRGYLDEFIASFKQAGFVTLLSVLYLFSVQEGDSYSRFTLFVTGGLYLVISYMIRCVWKAFLKKKKASYVRSLFMITTAADAPHMIANFNKYNYANVGISGIAIIDSDMTGEVISDIPVVADNKFVEDYVLSHWVDEILFGIPIDRDLLRSLILKFIEMGITVHQSLIELENSGNGIERNIERVGGYTVITRSIRILSAGELFLKRTIDILGGMIGCLITGILFLFVGPAIYLASPGPIFFSQNRIGKNGKVFKMYKFRSMYLDAEQRLKELKDQNEFDDNFMFKIENDPRIIGSEKGPGKGIGNLIRRTSIDEFPQFWNVLKGDMSLVGVGLILRAT